MNEVKERRAAMALRVAGILLVLLAIWFLTSCKDKGTGPDPPETEEFTKTITASENGTELDGVTFSIDGDVIGADTDAVEVTRETGTTETVTAAKDGFNDGSQTITFSDGSSESIELERADPETVAISYEIRSASSDTLVVADVINQETGETLAAGAASGTITLPFSDEATTLCAAPQYFGEGCVEVTPDGDKSIVIRITRESVDISFTVNDKSGNSVEDPEIVVEAGQGEMYTYANGERTHAFGARAGDRDVAVSAEGFITSELTLAAADDHDLTVELERKEKQPACNDGIDNDGDGVADANDSGCVDTFASTSRVPGTDGFVYEPEDDNEVLLKVQFSGSLTSDSRFVSSKKGEREFGLASTTFQNSIRYAVGPIDVFIKNLIETAQTGEAFALKIQCGPESEPASEHSNIITTDIVPDDQSVDGFRRSLMGGFTREILQDGTDCGFTALHATEVRDEPFGDGNDDVFFSTEDETGGVSVVWFYEEEEVQ
jgi:hypothetical protein